MKIRANSNSKFLRRFLLIAAVCFGYVLWGTYDILVTGPKHMKKAKEYWIESTNEGEVTWEKRHSGEEWNRIAKENDWPIGAPKTPPAAVGYLYFNYALVGICLIAGSISLIKFLKTNGTWMEATPDELTTSWGDQFAFQDIQSIDKKKWEHKGIATISYTGEGQQKTFVLDDFKYERQEADEILYLMEKGLSDDKIINGARELSAEQKAAAKAALEKERAELDTIEDDE